MSKCDRSSHVVVELAREYAKWVDDNRLEEPEDMPPPPCRRETAAWAKALVEIHDKHERLLMALRDITVRWESIQSTPAGLDLARELRKLATHNPTVTGW